MQLAWLSTVKYFSNDKENVNYYSSCQLIGAKQQHSSSTAAVRQQCGSSTAAPRQQHVNSSKRHILFSQTSCFIAIKDFNTEDLNSVSGLIINYNYNYSSSLYPEILLMSWPRSQVAPR